MDWQPIETAPAEEFEAVCLWNGKKVMAGSRYESIFVDHYADYIDPQPIAWMPLPPPPGDA